MIMTNNYYPIKLSSVHRWSILVFTCSKSLPKAKQGNGRMYKIRSSVVLGLQQRLWGVSGATFAPHSARLSPESTTTTALAYPKLHFMVIAAPMSCANLKTRLTYS